MMNGEFVKWKTLFEGRVEELVKENLACHGNVINKQLQNILHKCLIPKFLLIQLKFWRFWSL